MIILKGLLFEDLREGTTSILIDEEKKNEYLMRHSILLGILVSLFYIVVSFWNIQNKKRIVVSVIGCVLLGGAAVLVGMPFISNSINGYKIKKDLLSVYSGADIKGIYWHDEGYTKDEFADLISYIWKDEDAWPQEELYLFEVIVPEEDQGIAPVFGLAKKDGTVVFDEYAFLYYRDELREYVDDFLKPEQNFPEYEVNYEDETWANAFRLVPTHSCNTFDGYIDTKNVGYGMMASGEYVGYSVVISCEAHEDDVCQKLSEIFTDSGFPIYIVFSPEKIGIPLGTYYPDTGEFVIR